MDWYKLIVCSPIDRKARVVVSQKSCLDDYDIPTDDLLMMVEKFKRKQSLLKQILRIDSYRQKKNFSDKVNKGIDNFRSRIDSRAVYEFKRCGFHIDLFTREIGRRNSIIKAMRKQQEDRLRIIYASR